MWFLNDITIKSKGYSVFCIIRLCDKNNIKIGNAWHKKKYLGRIISDDDYQKLINLLENENINKKNRIIPNVPTNERYR